jgi:hypothetical protein
MQIKLISAATAADPKSAPAVAVDAAATAAPGTAVNQHPAQQLLLLSQSLENRPLQMLLLPQLTQLLRLLLVLPASAAAALLSC